MPLSLTIVIIVMLVTLIPLLALAFIYNRLIRHRNNLREAWSGIEVQLKLRHDLIPPLVQIVKSFAKHEKALLEAVTEKRTQASTQVHRAKPGQTNNAQDAENSLGTEISHLIALSEKYPDILADQHFRDLSQKLVTIEDQIQYARRYYNGTARDLNNTIETFPSNIVAKTLKFPIADFFEVSSASERISPDIANKIS